MCRDDQKASVVLPWIAKSKFLLVAAVTMFLTVQVKAAETSATNFPLGVNSALSAIYPPAGGTQIYNYDVAYTSDSYHASLGNPAPPSLHTTVFVEAVRVSHTWVDLTPDITLGSGFAINAIHQSLEIGGTKGDNGFQFANPGFIPYNFDFHVLPNLWVAHIMNIFPKWGQYSRRDFVTSGPGFASFVPEVALTYLPTQALELSLDGWVAFNTKNRSTGYQTGNELNVDYVVGYRPFLERAPGLQIGLNGYAYTQWTDDSLHGARVGDGNRGRVFAVGPQIRYDIGHGGLLAKWQHELGANNRPSGDRFWFEFTFPL